MILLETLGKVGSIINRATELKVSIFIVIREIFNCVSCNLNEGKRVLGLRLIRLDPGGRRVKSRIRTGNVAAFTA